MSLDRLRVDGWVVVEGFLTPDEVEQLNAVLSERRWPMIPDELVSWIADPRWAGLALGLLGPDVCFLREQLVTKAPRFGGEVPWHQDSGYALVAGEFLTFFVALDDITRDNGCLRMATGSHAGGLVEHRPKGYLREIAAPADAPGKPVSLAKGSVVAFSSFTHHSSGPNRTEGTRPAWMVQFGPVGVVDRRTGEPLEGLPVVAEGGRWLDRSEPD